MKDKQKFFSLEMVVSSENIKKYSELIRVLSFSIDLHNQDLKVVTINPACGVMCSYQKCEEESEFTITWSDRATNCCKNHLIQYVAAAATDNSDDRTDNPTVDYTRWKEHPLYERFKDEVKKRIDEIENENRKIHEEFWANKGVKNG